MLKPRARLPRTRSGCHGIYRETTRFQMVVILHFMYLFPFAGKASNKTSKLLSFKKVAKRSHSSQSFFSKNLSNNREFSS